MTPITASAVWLRAAERAAQAEGDAVTAPAEMPMPSTIRLSGRATP